MKQYYRLGIAADRDILHEYAHLFNGFVINAHIGSWASGWLPPFLHGLEKVYYIDPFTSIFSHNIEATLNPNGEQKASYAKLADRLPDVMHDALDNLSMIQSSTMLDAGVASNTVDRIMELQRELFLMRDPDQVSILEYLDYLDGGGKDDQLHPEFIVPPYFRFDSLDDPWFDVNRRMIELTIDRKEKDEKVMAVLHTTEGVVILGDAHERLTETVGVADAVNLWIDEFNEARASAALLSSLSDLIRTLEQAGKEVHLSYGGYLSIILQKVGLAGSCSGLGYGMSKGVESKTTGGGFPKRWYYQELHAYMDEAAFRSYFSTYPSELVCTCPACQASRGQAIRTAVEGTPEFIDGFMASMNKDRLNLHFLHCRNQEDHDTRDSSIEDIITQLRDIQEKAERNGFREYNIPFDFLDRWISFLSGLG